MENTRICPSCQQLMTYSDKYACRAAEKHNRICRTCHGKNQTGTGNPYYGKRHSETTRKKMSDNHADFNGDKNPFSKSIKNDVKKQKEHKERCLNNWKGRDRKRRKEIAAHKRTGYGEITGNHWSSIRYGAKSRNLELNITLEYIWDLFLKQDRKCALSGQHIFFGEMYKDEKTASLDRIDSSKGYIEGNLQWIHKKFQKMKGATKQEEFINNCKEVVDYSESFKYQG